MQFSQNSSLQPLLEGEVTVNLSLKCQRCLGPIEWQAETSIDFLIIESLNQNKTGLSSVNTIAVDSDGLSIEKIVEDEVLSMIPMSLMHNKVALCENNDTLGLFLAVSDKSNGKHQKNKPFSGLDKLLKAKDKD
jgi:uncharacterized metal-binding protein YceD (DUF177 family)